MAKNELMKMQTLSKDNRKLAAKLLMSNKSQEELKSQLPTNHGRRISADLKSLLKSSYIARN